jgi:hypothetical protein
LSASGGYEMAPATLMLATHCACCGRALLDSVSVETGVGPECRRKHGYNVDVDPDARAEANQLVHDIAVQQDGIEVARAAERLRVLGFVKLAGVVLKRCAPIRISYDGEGYVVVHSPYSEQATHAFRAIPGRRWDAEAKANVFPHYARAFVFRALLRAYPGQLAVGPKGVFELK